MSVSYLKYSRSFFAAILLFTSHYLSTFLPPYPALCFLHSISLSLTLFSVALCFSLLAICSTSLPLSVSVNFSLTSSPSLPYYMPHYLPPCLILSSLPLPLLLSISLPLSFSVTFYLFYSHVLCCSFSFYLLLHLCLHSALPPILYLSFTVSLYLPLSVYLCLYLSAFQYMSHPHLLSLPLFSSTSHFLLFFVTLSLFASLYSTLFLFLHLVPSPILHFSITPCLSLPLSHYLSFSCSFITEHSKFCSPFR